MYDLCLKNINVDRRTTNEYSPRTYNGQKKNPMFNCLKHINPLYCTSPIHPLYIYRVYIYIYITIYIYISPISPVTMIFPIFLGNHTSNTRAKLLVHPEDAVEFGEAEVVGGNFKAGFQPSEMVVYPWKMGISLVMTWRIQSRNVESLFWSWVCVH